MATTTAVRAGRRFDPTPSSVRQARALVRRVLTSAGDVPTDVVDRAVLVTSELATNAVRHAGTPYTVEVWLAEVIEIAVADACPRLPEQRSPLPHESSGRGLQLLDRLGDAWWVESHADGKRVWWRLSVEGPQTGRC